MNAIQKLQNEGWYITDSGLKELTNDNASSNINEIIKKALATDLKDIGKPIIQTNNDCLAEVILQIQKVRNISAPKSNPDSQAAPKLFKFTLTDGHNYVQAIDLDNNINLNQNNIPPGTKIKIRSGKMKNGFLLLDKNSFSILGGKVEALYEKWELSKSLTNHQRNLGNDGPPRWVNFGHKITGADVQLTKSVEKQTVKQNVEFEMLRKGAITEATAGGTKKVFGGGSKQILQQEVKKTQSYPVEKFQKRGKREPKEASEKPQKPPEKVSLFDYLETKLTVPETSKVVPENSNFNNVNNHKYLASQNMNNSHISQEQFGKFKSYDNKMLNRNYVDNNTKFNNNTGSSSRESYDNYKSKRNDYTTSSYQKPRNYNKNANFNHQTYQTNKTHTIQESQQSSSNNMASINDGEVVDNLAGDMQKLSVNSAFASRTLKQHLNLDKVKRENTPILSTLPPINWQVGDNCNAKYWEDGKYYKANITAVTEKTCVVQFIDYGNYEEVLKQDCLQIQGGPTFKKTGTRTFGNRNYFNKQRIMKN